MKQNVMAAAVGILGMMVMHPAQAAPVVDGTAWDAKERFMVRVRAVGVLPDENSSTSLGANSTVTVDDNFVPEIDFTYFFSDYIAAELIATVSEHNLDAHNPNLDLGSVDLIPPTLTLQYHFNPQGVFRPYVGAGVSYIHFTNDKPVSVASIDYDNGFGVVAQAGMDYALDEHWVVNADVKKVWHDVDVKASGGVTGDVDLDHWITGVGIGYRF